VRTYCSSFRVFSGGRVAHHLAFFNGGRIAHHLVFAVEEVLLII
jgi:hypothetical protein